MSTEHSNTEPDPSRIDQIESREQVAFDDADSRREEMRESLEAWVEQFAELAGEARVSESFQEWLDVQSRFHDYSYRNTLLIKRQCPGASKVAGYRTWQSEFDRHVTEGESAIWIWAPIITKRCPACENSESYHASSDCTYDATPPEEWDRGLVGFRPVPVFDISQTEGEPLPELDTTTRGDDARELREAMLAAAPRLDIDAQLIPPNAWSHGDADGICKHDARADGLASIEVKAVSKDAQVTSVLAHEYAHALLHVDDETEVERAKREVEAESAAYVVAQHFGLDATKSALYVAAWDSDSASTIKDRLTRIVEAARDIIDAV